ncbi:amidase family protein [Falsiroseomonas sp. HW251]|uniref:amidase family protein n=1 Tax=Falsiroseomonas sp. HW251 TaxID=3390998 RepID=UPI003D314F9D
MTELCDLTAVALLARIAAGAATAEDVRESCLARIAAREVSLQVFAHLDPDAVRAMRPAPGPLGGLPLGVKDIIDVAGMPTQMNSPIWRGWMPRADAACVAAARAAGALVIGKTVTTEFATRHPGPTANPHDVAHTPGGSSSGSAAGVAAGFFPFALGTQTGGSITRPASYCGVVGYKPSFGLIHRGGIKVMSDSFDTVGVMARGVADCALLVGAMAATDLGDPDRHPGRPPRLLVTPGPDAGRIDACMLALLDQVATAARRRGAIVVGNDLPPVIAAAEPAHRMVGPFESAQALAWELASFSDALTEGLRSRMLQGRSRDGEAIAAARKALATARAALVDLFADHDAIVTPAAPAEAPATRDWTGEPIFNQLWTSLHLPCVAIPTGSGPHGLPLGLQVIGAPGADRQALAWAEWLRSAVA